MPCLSALLVALAAAGCQPTTDTTTNTINTTQYIIPTSVSVDPGSFLGDVVCGDRPGAMQSYVATVTDVTDPANLIVLPSSPPTPCSQSVYFEYVNVGSRYTAVVDGYEQPASSLVPACGAQPPAGGAAPREGGLCKVDGDCQFWGCFGHCNTETKTTADGSVVFDPITKKPETQDVCRYRPVSGDRHVFLLRSPYAAVSPRWQTPVDQACGAAGPAVAQSYANASIGGCGALEDHGMPGVTTIEVDPHATLTGTLLSCASATSAGTVTGFDIVPLDPALPKVTGIACDAKAVSFDQGVVADRDYVFTIDGYEAGASMPTQSASCFTTARAGTTVVTVCDPLAQKH